MSDDTTCLDCEGHGYAAFMCDGEGHPGAELQRCDSCQDLSRDTEAVVAFVWELEAGDAYAQEQARFLLDHGAPIRGEEDLPQWTDNRDSR